jgi:ATP-binding cassette subfamily B protein
LGGLASNSLALLNFLYCDVSSVQLDDTSAHFREVYKNIRQRLRNEQLQLIRHQAFADLAAGTLSVTVTGIVMAIMVWRALQAQISLGDLTLLYQAFNQGQSLIKNLLSNTGKIYFNSLFIENLKEFLNLTPILKETANSYPIPIPIKDSIEFKNFVFVIPIVLVGL